MTSSFVYDSDLEMPGVNVSHSTTTSGPQHTVAEWQWRVHDHGLEPGPWRPQRASAWELLGTTWRSLGSKVLVLWRTSLAAPPVLYQKLHDSGLVERGDQEEEMRRRRRLVTALQLSHVITAVLITDHCGGLDVVSPTVLPI